ncbi:hypothetical protein QR680_005768 [Steinernema hermaphroditum]|uniref:Uncharacterized protein n=1 Tax=Steinernema hermaphroditum TaxID=289476 RepID=A0AA39HUL2_9BILA|nr:hypothetical protein QR680_005768 [Steinernema hermaphroditum]
MAPYEANQSVTFFPKVSSLSTCSLSFICLPPPQPNFGFQLVSGVIFMALYTSGGTMTDACRHEFALFLLCTVVLTCFVACSQGYPFPASPAEDERLVLILHPLYVYRNAANDRPTNVDSLQKWLDHFTGEVERREVAKRNIAIGRGDGFRPGK